MPGGAETVTIFALSSAAGRAGIAVVRISGPAARDGLMAMTGRDPPPARQATLRAVLDPADGRPLDRAFVLWLPGPGSFTGEDIVEIHLHGGRATVDQVLVSLGRIDGLRPAEPGEFTRRAFHHGKLDLAEVEGLADLINAETEAQRRLAFAHFDGHFSRHIETWRDDLVKVLAHLEATIDFPDEDLPPEVEEMRKSKILCLNEKISQYLVDSHRGERLRDGLQIAIVGPPNVGKSSLLNHLAARDVAIVSATAGTTRDLIETHLDVEGYPVTLVDTAGLRSLSDAGSRAAAGDIEAEGMRRARARAEAADLKLIVFDGTTWPDLDSATLGMIDRDSLVVFNKADLMTGAAPPAEIKQRPVLPLSAKTGQGIRRFLSVLADDVKTRLASQAGAPPLTRVRHRAAIEDCREALVRSLETDVSELVAEDLRLAVRALGRVTGRVDVEDLLDVVFRDFCIGK